MYANKLYGEVMKIEQKIKDLLQNANFLSHGYNYHAPREDHVNQILLEQLGEMKKIKENTAEYIDTYNSLYIQISQIDAETENILGYMKEHYATNPKYSEIVENLLSSINSIEMPGLDLEDNENDKENSYITNVNELTLRDEEDSPTADSSNSIEDFSIKTPQKNFVNVFISKSDSRANQPMDTPAIKSSKAKRTNF